MLFQIFINDLEVNTKSLLLKFEDDTKIGRVINNEDRTIIQSDLDHSVSRAHSNKIHFYAAKSKVNIRKQRCMARPDLPVLPSSF